MRVEEYAMSNALQIEASTSMVQLGGDGDKSLPSRELRLFVASTSVSHFIAIVIFTRLCYCFL
jgi:hypothetical protein